jgi:hypothetical protein
MDFRNHLIKALLEVLVVLVAVAAVDFLHQSMMNVMLLLSVLGLVVCQVQPFCPLDMVYNTEIIELI